MTKRSRIIITICALVALGAVSAQANWYDGFESYTAGSGIHGMGGWSGWNDDPAFDAIISDFFAYAGSQSVAITGAADIVHRFSGYDAGVWNFRAWMLIPAGFTGETYFLMLNTYEPNGSQNWSTQIRFTNGMIVTDTPGGESMPYVTGQWAELLLTIDLNADLQTFYYDGVMLYQASWTEGVSGGGVPNIACVDLFANAATEVYYDELSLEMATVAVESKSLSQVKALFR
jgi:hypothetical protein